MKMNRKWSLTLTALSFHTSMASAAIQNSDFWFHNDGDIVFINGPKGAPLHIDYIGPALTKPLTVRVKSDNRQLKVSPQTCTFTKKDDDCRLIVHYAKQGDKVYGVNQFTITEEGSSQGPLKADAASDAGAVGFGVGVQGKDMPKPMIVVVREGPTYDTVGRAVIVNATQERRNYIVGYKEEKYLWYNHHSTDHSMSSREFSLPPKSLCYPDINLALAWNAANYLILDAENPLVSRADPLPISDITNPLDPIYNSFLKDPENNITSCSASKNPFCASNKWGSMAVGLANLGSDDMKGGVRAGQIEILRDNSWGNKAYIYYTGSWNSNSLALLQIQGSTDGSENWDVNAAAPSILEIKSAYPCSYYAKPDPDESVTFTVRLKIFGPGTITMPAGAQCQKYNTPGEDFTYCTGSGYRDTGYEMTAVPEAGKTFRGWGSDGLCDDSKTTCRFPLTQNVSLKPFFW